MLLFRMSTELIVRCNQKPVYGTRLTFGTSNRKTSEKITYVGLKLKTCWKVFHDTKTE